MMYRVYSVYMSSSIVYICPGPSLTTGKCAVCNWSGRVDRDVRGVFGRVNDIDNLCGEQPEQSFYDLLLEAFRVSMRHGTTPAAQGMAF